MKKIFILRPSEDWIVDRFVTEWYQDNPDISTTNPYEAEIIWLFADWCWSQIDYGLLLQKKVITTIHHIVEEKFDFVDFSYKDKFTNIYHVPNHHTKSFLEKFTKKPIVTIPYWANQKIWRKTNDKISLRQKYSLPEDFYLIGSFQRDTEGKDLISPKLEKGPDLLVDFIEYKNSLLTTKQIHVVLAGWRRQYVINRLTKSKIPFTYFERPSHEVVNELYQCLDLYPVSARYEGGPQSLIECGLLDIPVISRDIGVASVVLSRQSINNDLKLAIPSIPNVENLKLPLGYKPFKELFNSLC